MKKRAILLRTEKGDCVMKEENEKLKYEIAEELGLLEKVKTGGWRSLTAKETGRIGGLITKKRKEMKNSITRV